MRLQIVRGLLGTIDVAYNSLLAKHLGDIRTEAREFGNDEIARQVEELLRRLEASGETVEQELGVPSPRREAAAPGRFRGRFPGVSCSGCVNMTDKTNSCLPDIRLAHNLRCALALAPVKSSNFILR